MPRTKCVNCGPNVRLPASRMPDPSSLRGGHDYQDLVAMRAIIELLRYPDRIADVELEADDAGSIDDVRVRYREPRELRMEVKFAVDETDNGTWQALLKVRNGPGQSAKRPTTKAASENKGKERPAEVTP